MGSQGVGNDLATEHACTLEIFTDLYVCVCMYIYIHIHIYIYIYILSSFQKTLPFRELP